MTSVSSAAESGGVLNRGAARFATFRVPAAAMNGAIVDPDQAVLRPIPAATEALQLLRGYVGVLDNMSALASPETQRSVVTHFCDLMAIAIGATRDANETGQRRGVSAARLQAIKADICRNSGDPGLNLTAVATRNAVTPRYVQMLFEGAGTSYSQYVLDQRLRAAHRLLTDPRFARRAIGDIALDVGFGDLSYFNRSFRRRFGATPGDVRHGGGRDADPGRDAPDRD